MDDVGREDDVRTSDPAAGESVGAPAERDVAGTASAPVTLVHLVRHGQVENPGHVLYGRLPGWHLSALGRAMASLLGEYFADVPLVHLRCSPLERAQETMEPIASAHPAVPVITDERLIETANVFEGQIFGPKVEALRHPGNWRHLYNPFRPSWGESYRAIAARMRAAIVDAARTVRDAAGESGIGPAVGPVGPAVGPVGEAVIVSHELPIWIARRDAEGRGFVHDPRRRQCRLASVTTFTLAGDTVVKIDYVEPARDLLP